MDERTNGRTNGRTESLTPISHLAISRCDNKKDKTSGTTLVIPCELGMQLLKCVFAAIRNLCVDAELHEWLFKADVFTAEILKKRSVESDL